MSLTSLVSPSPRFENLGGGYKTDSSLGGEGFDSVAFITGRKPLNLPTDALPGISTPIPTTTQKPNRTSNIPIVYPRTSSAYVQSGEIVFVDKYSDGGIGNKRANPGMRGGAGVSNARVATIEQVNSILASEPPVPNQGDIVKEPAPGEQAHEALRWNLDGVCLSIDTDDAIDMMPGHASTSDHRAYPLLNVVVQNHALTLSDEEGDMYGSQAWTGPRIESRKVCPKGSAAGAVVYVGLFAEATDGGNFIGKLRRFCSSDVTSGKERLDNIQRAWQLGKVVDTNSATKPRKVTIAIRIRRIEEAAVFYQDEGLAVPRPPYVTKRDRDVHGDTRELRTPLDAEEELKKMKATPAEPPFVKGVRMRSVKDQLTDKWHTS